MTTWSVVKDDTREKRWQDHFPRSLPRYALLACLALVVVSLGVVLTPARPPEPAEPPFSEQARAAALAETLQLLDAGSQLGTAARAGSKDSPASADGRPAAAGNPAIERTVTLLTTQAQALLAPGRKSCGPGRRGCRLRPGNAPGSVLRRIGCRFRPSAAGAPPHRCRRPPPGSWRLSRTAAASASRTRPWPTAAWHGCWPPSAPPSCCRRPRWPRHRNGGAGRRRASPAAVRHLPVAQPRGAVRRRPVPPPGRPRRAVPSSPSAAAASLRRRAWRSAASGPRRRPSTATRWPARLSGAAAASAAEQLARHEELLGGAESLSRRCASAIPPREAGYALGQSFLASPAAGLGKPGGRHAARLRRPRGAERGRDPAVGHRGPARLREAVRRSGARTRRTAGPGQAHRCRRLRRSVS